MVVFGQEINCSGSAPHLPFLGYTANPAGKSKINYIFNVSV